MSKKKPLPNVAKCGCGGTKKLIPCSPGIWRVRCRDCGMMGPQRCGRMNAIYAWNMGMTGIWA